MQVIIRFIRRNFYIILFLILQAFAFSQVVTFNAYPRTYYFNSSKSYLAKINGLSNLATGYFHLVDKNQALALENIQLRNSLKSNYLLVDTGLYLIKDTAGRKRYDYFKADVIKSTTNKLNNFITINKGKNHGVRKGMAVLSPSGIAGVVYDVTDHFSLVLSVLNSKFRTTPMIPELNAREGTLYWNGESSLYAQITDVNKFEKIRPGMSVTTSNYSTLFPSNVPIGKVVSFKPAKNTAFWEIKVELATNFSKLSTVYLVRDRYQTELDTISNREARFGN